MRTFLSGLQDPRCESAKNSILVTPALRGSMADSMDMMVEILGDFRVLQIQPKEVFLQYQMLGEEASEVEELEDLVEEEGEWVEEERED